MHEMKKLGWLVVFGFGLRCWVVFGLSLGLFFSGWLNPSSGGNGRNSRLKSDDKAMISTWKSSGNLGVRPPVDLISSSKRHT